MLSEQLDLLANPEGIRVMRSRLPLILASGSPRRRELLSDLGVPFHIVNSHIEETIAPDLGPEEQAIALAEQKASAVASNFETGVVLGADTVVAVAGKLLGKPRDDADAIAMLGLLSNRDHSVVTGLTIVDAATGFTQSSAVSSTVRFHTLSKDDIAAYVATGEPRDKAGAYAIQGLGAQFVANLEGCFTNVVGLPLCETAKILTNWGIDVSPTWSGCRLPGGGRCPRQV